ncbi:hypothetical protein EGW08_013833, partial [Elysia chlorotica]
NSQQSHVSYAQAAPQAADNYYSYSVGTAQVQPGDHYNSSEAPAQAYSVEQTVPSYSAEPQYQPQYQQTAQQLYQQTPQPQQQQQHHYQVAPQPQHYQQQYQEPVATHPTSQYQYDTVSHSADVYSVGNPTHSAADNYTYQNVSEGTWSTENQYVEPLGYYGSEPASVGGYQQEPSRYAPSTVRPAADTRNSFAAYSENRNSSEFTSYSESTFSASTGYNKDRLNSKANFSEPEAFHSSKPDFGGYSGPATFTRGNWRRPADRGRGGQLATGHGSNHQDSRGSRTDNAWSDPSQRRSEHGGNWRGGGNQSRRPAEFQSSPSFDARKRFDGADDNNRFSRGKGFSFNYSRGKLQPPAYGPAQPAKPAADDTPVYQTPKPYKKTEVLKAPSRPQDRLLNEVEGKAKPAEKKKPSPEELKKIEEERKKAEEEAKKKAEEEKIKAEEEAQKRAEQEKKRAEEEQRKAAEELRKKLADEAVKAAPPSKPPETAEEIAYEEEIQRKIRESVVVLTSTVEEPAPAVQADPMAELEMSEELRELLKSITTQYLCKLCSVRIVGPQMAGMHYNGKNHLKKLRNFVQTNGRSAGFYLGVEEQKTKETKDDEGKNGENKAEAVEATEVDEKKYCKICKVSFSQPSQAEMHYKGKNHAKKLKNCGGVDGTGPEVFECKICCVTVTAQEHLTAHLNGARHKQQVRKIDANESYSGSVPNRGRGGLGYRGRGGRGGGSDWKPGSDGGQRGGRGGFRGRGRGEVRGRGSLDQGVKRQAFQPDDGFYRPEGPPMFKRPRF